MSSQGNELRGSGRGSIPPVGWFLGLPWMQSIGVVGSLVLAAKATSLMALWEGAADLPDFALPLWRVLLLGFAGCFGFLAYRRFVPHLEKLSQGKVGSQGLRPGVEKALAACDDGRVQDAYALLEVEMRRHSGDAELAARFWDTALACGRGKDAAPYMVRTVSSLLNARRDEEAAAIWVDVCSVVPDPPADARALVKLAPLLAKDEDQADLAAAALRRAVAEDTQGFSLGLALRVVELSQDTDPEVAAIAARRAMKVEALDDDKRDRLVFLLKDLEAEKGRREVEKKEAGKKAQSEIDPTGIGSDDSQWEHRADSIDIDLEEPAMAAPPVVEKAKPHEGLSMDLAEDGPDDLDADLPAVFDMSSRPLEVPDLDPGEPDSTLGGAANPLEPGLDLSEADLGTGGEGVGLASGPMASFATEPSNQMASSTSTFAVGKDPITGKSLVSERPSLKGAGSAFGGPEQAPEPALEIESAPEIAEAPAPEALPQPEIAASPAPEVEPEPEVVEVPAAKPQEAPRVADSPPCSGARFREVQVMEVVPVEIGEEALSIRLKNGRTARLAFAEVQAVAVAAVLGLSEKPVAVLDLATNWKDEGGGKLRVVRLRSDAYDPRKFASECKSVSEALRLLVREILGKSGCELLPVGMEADAISFQKFSDLKAYEREVLEVEH